VFLPGPAGFGAADFLPAWCWPAAGGVNRGWDLVPAHRIELWDRVWPALVDS